MFTIIEDCSPYYIRFTHPGIEKVIELCKTQNFDIDRPATSFGITRSNEFIPSNLSDEFAKELFTHIPMSEQFFFNYASFFISKPGCKFHIHKDGKATTFGFNYSIQILDESCKTNFYSDDIVNHHKYIEDTNSEGKTSRSVVVCGEPPIPEKTAVFKPNECILFNAGIFHNWDNSESQNIRVMLVLRALDSIHLSFDDAKKMFFGI